MLAGSTHASQQFLVPSDAVRGEYYTNCEFSNRPPGANPVRITLVTVCAFHLYRLLLFNFK